MRSIQTRYRKEGYEQGRDGLELSYPGMMTNSISQHSWREGWASGHTDYVNAMVEEQDRCEDEDNWRDGTLYPLAARLGLDPSDLEELVDLIVKVVAEGKKL